MRILTLLFVISFFGCNKKKPAKEAEDSYRAQVEKVAKEEPQEEEISNSWDNPEIEKLSINGYFPKFVPNQEAIIYSSKNYKGLWLLDLATKEVRQLTDENGAGYQPTVLEDKVIYKVKARLSYLEEVNLSTGEVQKVEKQYARYSPIQYANLSSKQDVSVALSSDLLSIEIMKNNEITSIAPKGSKNYISVALSPNRSDILYKVAGLGAFISNLEGVESHSLGDVDQPSWVNENQIVYAVSEDDGMNTESSEVVVFNLKEQKQYNVSETIEDQVENPTSSDSGDMLLMNTQSGSVYLVKN